MFFTLQPTHKRHRTPHDPSHFCLRNGIATLSPEVANHIARSVSQGIRPQLFVVGFLQEDGSINVGIDIPKVSRFRGTESVASEPIATLPLWETEEES